MFKRVILKLSGEALAATSGADFDEQKIREIAKVLHKIVSEGVQLGIVVGGGNFWRGRSAAPHLDRYKSDQIGMLATIMNALYLTDVFRSEGLKAIIMTPFQVGTVSELFSKDKALEHMQNGKVIIFAAGTGHPYFSTDTAVALRGVELEADCLLFAKNGIQYVHEDDPRTNPNAKRIEQLSFNEILSNKNINVIDSNAACICAEGNISAVIFGMDEPENIYKVAMGERIGTLVTNN